MSRLTDPAGRITSHFWATLREAKYTYDLSVQRKQSGFRSLLIENPYRANEQPSACACSAARVYEVEKDWGPLLRAPIARIIIHNISRPPFMETWGLNPKPSTWDQSP